MTKAQALEIARQGQAPLGIEGIASPLNPLTTVALTPMLMLDRAVQSGAGADTLEKLMGLQERHEKNQARKAFDNAMSEAKSRIPVIFKSQQGHNYQYEDMASIARVVDPILAECGLSYRFKSESNEVVKITCVICHRDGHSEENSLSARPDTTGSKNPIQAIGSAVTYLQRYTLKLALGISASKDDDGAAVSVKRDVASVVLEDDQLPKAKSRPVYEALVKEMRAITTLDDLSKWGLENTSRIYTMHADFQKFFRNEYADHLTAIKEGVTEEGKPLVKALKASLEIEPGEVEAF